MKKRNLHLSEILDRDGIDYGGNNLILSPVGSGKTHLIVDLLKEYEGKKLLLVPTKSLMDSLYNIVGTLVTQESRRKIMNIEEDDDIYVMTYKEFGEKIKWSDKFANDYNLILCEDIHFLFEYFMKYSDSSAHFKGESNYFGEAIYFFVVISYLMKENSYNDIFCFTSQNEMIDIFASYFYGDVYSCFNVIDYMSNYEILKSNN